MTATQPQRDKHAWDFYVQVAAPHGPDDARERSCKVQVKTTTTEKPSAEISLSNLELMALERLPWFILHVLIKDSKVDKAYLLHVDEAQVARILKRREEADPAKAHNEIGLTISAQASDALTEPFHVSLRKRLLDDMVESEKAYYDRKSKWIETAGYEEAPIRFSVTFPPMEDHEYWEQAANWAVRLVDKMPIASVKAERLRFGVPTTLTEGAAGTMSAPGVPPTATQVVAFSNTDQSEMVSIKCEMYVASRVVPFLPPEYNRVRFVAPGIDILLREDQGRAIAGMTFPIPGITIEGEQASLTEFAKACKVVRLISQAGDKGIWMDIAGLASSRVQLSAPKLDPEVPRLALVIESAAAVISGFGIETGADVDVGDLLENAFDVTLMHAGLRRDVGIFDASVRFERFEGGIQIEKPEVQVYYKQSVKRTEWNVETYEATTATAIRKLANELRDGFDIIVAPPSFEDSVNEPDNPEEDLNGKRAVILKPAVVMIGEYVVSALFALTGTCRWINASTVAGRHSGGQGAALRSRVVDGAAPGLEEGGQEAQSRSHGEADPWDPRAQRLSRAVRFVTTCRPN
jgi:hypothetical protein